MDRSIDVATAESVAFSYELAGLGSRFLAVFIDMLIQWTCALAIFLGIGLLLSALPGAAAKASPGLGKLSMSLVLAATIAAAFALFFGYFIAFEWLWNGRTPGKRALGIRVVRDGGFPVDFPSSVVRNVVRVLEAGLGFYAISAAVVLLSPQNRRLGDMAAGTIVVRDDRFEAADGFALVETADPLVRDVPDAERELVRRYVERRESLAPRPRVALARSIAEVVRPRLGASFAHLDDDAMLVHVW